MPSISPQKTLPTKKRTTLTPKKCGFTKLSSKCFSAGELCGICYDDLCDNDHHPNSENLEFGAIDGCSHVFHLKCIKKWTTEMQNSCPECRVKVKYLCAYEPTGEPTLVYRVRKPKKEEEEDSQIEVPDHMLDKCAICGLTENGNQDFLCCDGMSHTCDKVFHIGCAGYQRVPGRDLFCKDCAKNEKKTSVFEGLENRLQIIDGKKKGKAKEKALPKVQNYDCLLSSSSESLSSESESEWNSEDFSESDVDFSSIQPKKRALKRSRVISEDSFINDGSIDEYSCSGDSEISIIQKKKRDKTNRKKKNKAKGNNSQEKLTAKKRETQVNRFLADMRRNSKLRLSENDCLSLDGKRKMQNPPNKRKRVSDSLFGESSDECVESFLKDLRGSALPSKQGEEKLRNSIITDDKIASFLDELRGLNSPLKARKNLVKEVNGLKSPLKSMEHPTETTPKQKREGKRHSKEVGLDEAKLDEFLHELRSRPNAQDYNEEADLEVSDDEVKIGHRAVARDKIPSGKGSWWDALDQAINVSSASQRSRRGSGLPKKKRRNVKGMYDDLGKPGAALVGEEADKVLNSTFYAVEPPCAPLPKRPSYSLAKPTGGTESNLSRVLKTASESFNFPKNFPPPLSIRPPPSTVRNSHIQ